MSSASSRAAPNTSRNEENPRIGYRGAYRYVREPDLFLLELDTLARVREETHVKGTALFHPIRVALTGAVEGPELDLAVPAIERGARQRASSGWRPVMSCRERAGAFARALAREGR